MAEERVNVLYDTRLPKLSRWRRAQIPVIAAVVSALIDAIGPTLRFESVGENLVDEWMGGGRPCIGAFWHRCIFSAVWRQRGRGVVVMNTTNFDGQWTRRVIERFGFDTSQGSSTRGGLRGLVDMARKIEMGRSAAFTIDGPRGPRYVAKPGPVIWRGRPGRRFIRFILDCRRRGLWRRLGTCFRCRSRSRGRCLWAGRLFLCRGTRGRR